jgi:hypothetical protein
MLNLGKNGVLEKLIYRRQFVLGPHYVDQLAHWKRLKIGQNLYLSAHPDLNLVHRESADASLTLLGYILNPNQPEADDRMIIDQLLQKVHAANGIKDIIQSTEVLGGRWILIAKTKDNWFLFNDPCGYRAAFYTDRCSENNFWCASQPGLFRFVLNLNADPDAIDYLDTNKYRHYGNKEFIFPGERSIFKEIKHLLPNHYLNLNSGSVKRYWPNESLEPIAFNDCVAESSRILINTMKAAARRFKLALSLTAGRDSRLILASSRQIADQIHFFTGIYWNHDKKSPDAVIPAKLLSKLNLKHQVIQCPKKMKRSFARIYNANVTPAHAVYGTIAQGFFAQLPQDRVMLKGNAIPIIKGGYDYYRKNNEITPQFFNKVLGVDGSPFAQNAIQKWLNGIQNTIFNVDILELFQWEIKEGSWQAMSQLEWDLVTEEILVPYNNRYLLALMLGLDKEHRIKPDYRLHEALTRYSWPELLEYPINPRIKKRRTIFSRVKTKMNSVFNSYFSN